MIMAGLPHFKNDSYSIGLFIYCTECFLIHSQVMFCECKNKNIVSEYKENLEDINMKRKLYLRQQKLKRIL